MKSIFITGASSGIGRASAEHFLENGWRVGLIAQSADALAEIVHENAVALPCDVTDEEQVQATFDTFSENLQHTIEGCRERQALRSAEATPDDPGAARDESEAEFAEADDVPF